MNICRTCISKLHPDYFTAVNPDTIPWSRATCHHCGVHSEEILSATHEMLENPQPLPPSKQPKTRKQITRKAKRPATQPATTDRETYQYLLIDWDNSPPSHDYLTTKNKLLALIETAAIKRNYKNIDVYKLTPLEHKAEIKIEIGE